MKNIVVIGGGTGTFTLLTGLKHYDHLSLTAIVTMADDGGSTGELRDEYGTLPAGDVRQCLIALSTSDLLMRKLFLYRFTSGRLKGHNFGNLLLTALEKISGSFDEAIAQASKVLAVKGKVIPSTIQQTRLVAELENGAIVQGEHNIDEPRHDGNLRIRKIWLEPKVRLHRAAFEAIRKADMIVIGPGDLYTSLIPNLLVAGMAKAIKESRARKVFLMNLMTKFGQTTGYAASQHMESLQKYLGSGVDAVIINTQKPSLELLSIYRREHEFPVADDFPKSSGKYRIIRKPLLNKSMKSKPGSDRLRRSLIRHHPQKLSKVVVSLL